MEGLLYSHDSRCWYVSIMHVAQLPDKITPSVRTLLKEKVSRIVSENRFQSKNLAIFEDLEGVKSSLAC